MEQYILCIDNNVQRVSEIRDALPAKPQILQAFSWKDAAKLVSQHTLSAVVVSINEEDREAYFQFLVDLRTVRPMPILCIDVIGPEEEARAYRLGADLCIRTPADAGLLVEAIGAALRRHYELNGITQLRKVGMPLRKKDLTLYPQSRTVTMRGESVQLLAKEFDILYFLMRNPGIVFKKERIYEVVWSEEYSYGCRSVQDHISNIRKKLGLPAADKEYIETLYHVGYRFVP